MLKILFTNLITGFSMIMAGQSSELADFIANERFKEKSWGEVKPSLTDNYFFRIENGVLKNYSFINGKEFRKLVDFNSEEFSEIGHPEGFSLSNNEKRVLFCTEINPLYRYSFYAKNFVYNLNDSSLQFIDDTFHIRDAKFSPDGEFVSFIKENNLFVQDLKTNKVKRITSDGKKDSIINGAPDWVYEEEFLLKSAYAWSPDGKYIAFLKFNESLVSNYLITLFNENNYPEQVSYKYPKTGENNSIVSVWVYETGTGKIKRLFTAENDLYIPRFSWTDKSGILSFVTLNRLQNQLEIKLTDVFSGKSETIYIESNPKYIQDLPEKYPVFYTNENDFLFTSEQNGMMQIFKFNYVQKKYEALTKTGEVIEIIGVDKENQKIFYSVSESPLHKTVKSVSFDGKLLTTIGLSTGQNEVIFNYNYSGCILKHHDSQHAIAEYLCSSDGAVTDTLMNNAELENDICKSGVPLRDFFTFRTSEGVDLNGYMLKPKDFDVSKKYPVLMFVYGGPGSQQVLDAWKINWLNYMAVQGYLVVCVDNRGTGGRGAAFRNITYGNLGIIETKDQIETAKYLQKQTYVDPRRIGIYGWSYGGYLSLMCLMQGDGIFKAGISVAPPVHWKFYDTVYGERYMGLPSENATGYEISSVLSYTPLMKGKLLLIHGTADDNVHIQNSMVLADALVRDNKNLEMFFYPNKNHSILGGNTRLHLFQKMTDFIKANL